MMEVLGIQLALMLMWAWIWPSAAGAWLGRILFTMAIVRKNWHEDEDD